MKMVQTPNNTDIKLLSPTLHCYYYVLQNSLNDSSDSLRERRKIFSDNLNKVEKYFKGELDKNNDDLFKLISLKPDILSSGSLLDFEAISADYYKPNDDRLYIDYGMLKNRLAVRCLNDTYFLRVTRYISNQYGVQSLKQFYHHLRKPISNLETQLGKTVILAGILPESVSPSTEIATDCLNYYYNFTVEAKDYIQAKNLIENEFLGSKFYIYKKMVIAEQVEEYTVESIELVCVFLYANEETEKKADKVYQLLPELLLSYHKIHFFDSQSLILKKLLNQKYEILERQTEKSHLTRDKLTLIRNLPQESLNYYKKLSFLEDQQRTISINSTNYDSLIKKIEQEIGNKMPDFFIEAQKDFKFYSDQIESNINFLRPGIELYEKLMLSVQTEVSLDQATIQERQAKLGQLLTGSCAAIAIGQILNTPITVTVSELLDENSTQPSINSLWLGSLLTILFSVLAGYEISKRVYQWFTKEKL